MTNDRSCRWRTGRRRNGPGVEIVNDQGLSTELPHESESFDRVLSSLFFHHLSREDKGRTAKEVYRGLKPRGEFHIVDWGKAQNSLMRTLFWLVQLLDGLENTRDHVQGLPSM
ncbi:MAG: class I SAM-dependent methyltransferase [Gammaproteobacteria bacterium]